VIFIVALGVRLLEWQDREIDIQGTGPLQLLDRMAQHYQHEARRTIDQGHVLFSYPDNPGDAHPVLHPPGYSVLLAGLYGSTEPTGPGAFHLLRLLQVICDAAASVLVVLTTAELLPIGVAMIAGGLVAFSPQLAYYSLWLTPEPLSSFVIVIAVYIMVRAIARTTGRTRTAAILLVGTMVGISCWLRSINLLLGPFLCLVIWASIERGKRLRSSIALLAPVAVLILPIAVRNWSAYHRFIPLSIGSGITLIEGIAEYDTQGRFDLPRIDDDAKAKDAEWYGRPEYGGSPWSPDGVDRDRARLARGLSVIRSNPIWFLGVMLRRGSSMLRYNDDLEQGWPADSAKAPVIQKEPPYAHSLGDAQASQPMWQLAAQSLASGGKMISPNASLAQNGSEAEILCDESDFGDQFVSEPIPVRPFTDYGMKARIKFVPGVAMKVTSSDRRVMLAAAFKSESQTALNEERSNTLVAAPPDSSDDEPEAVETGFASGKRSEVRLVISNNGKTHSRPTVRLGAVELFELGPTPHQWSRYVRPIARSIQRRLYTTSSMLILFALGLLLLATAGRGRTLLMLLAIPLYYLSTQSTLHTEYRYTLPIHYFLFVLAAVALYLALVGTSVGALRLKRAYFDHHRKSTVS
jgi:hypothetical protein